MRQPRPKPSESAEIELIRSLYDSLVPAVIMSLGFLLCGGLIVLVAQDVLLAIPYVGGLIASVIRLMVVSVDTRRVWREDLTITRARALEQRFAISYILFAIMLGLFGGRGLMLGAGPIELPTIVMIVGYGAGVAAGIGLRPRVALVSMAIGIVPSIVALLAQQEILHVAAGLFTTALLVGGMGSVARRHRQTVADIDRRLGFATLARNDDLTGLPNRLGLREWFVDRVPVGRAGTIAVHCLDLDGFKPVNDRYGHPVGDLLLVAVARRLHHAIRQGDLAVRLGGDEFAIVQLDIVDDDQAHQLATRLVQTISHPFEIGGLTLSISTCVGTVVAGAGKIEDLLALADEALYDAKRAGPGLAARLERSDVPAWIG